MKVHIAILTKKSKNLTVLVEIACPTTVRFWFGWIFWLVGWLGFFLKGTFLQAENYKIVRNVGKVLLAAT